MAKITLGQSFCTSDQPFSFSVKLPEGNYTIRVTFGDPNGVSVTTVKAEVRRLMLPLLTTGYGEVTTEAFTVNIRQPYLPDGRKVNLKPRELESEWRNWDSKLTLQFSNRRPCVRALEILPAIVPTVFLAGDSTVTDQGGEPYSSWGQVLPSFFNSRIAIANYAESGESLQSFTAAGRLAKILSVLKPNDYLFIQFGHNDMKETGSGVGPHTTYRASLIEFISAARSKGANPVLLTPMNRRSFDSDGRIVNTFVTSGPDGGDYTEAVRAVAKEQNVPLIDLNAASKTLYETLGVEGSKKLFVHYPANSFPGQTEELQDNSHFNLYGAYQLAKCVVMGIKRNNLSLSEFLRPMADFNPTYPDPITLLDIPPDPQFIPEKPFGS